MMRKSNVRVLCTLGGLSVVLLMVLVGCAALKSSLGIAETGIFLDGPVSGLAYKTPTMEGVTGADGVFRYKAGETVTFSIGSLVLGSTIGKAVVTPLDIVPDAKDTKDQRVVNICVLLQTLDQDGDAANGIVISEKAASFVTLYGKDINFDKPVRAFSFDGGLRATMAELNNIDFFGETPRAVKPPVVAQKHLETTLAELAKKAIPEKK